MEVQTTLPRMGEVAGLSILTGENGKKGNTECFGKPGKGGRAGVNWWVTRITLYQKSGSDARWEALSTQGGGAGTAVL